MRFNFFHLVLGAFFLMVFYFLFFGIRSLYEYENLKKQNLQLKTELAQLKRQNLEIEHILKLQSNSSFSESALTTYGYRKTNEALVEIVPPELITKTSEQKSFFSYYLFAGFILVLSLFLLLFYFPKKNWPHFFKKKNGYPDSSKSHE
jgi:cell division protein FtsB